MRKRNKTLFFDTTHFRDPWTQHNDTLFGWLLVYKYYAKPVFNMPKDVCKLIAQKLETKIDLTETIVGYHGTEYRLRQGSTCYSWASSPPKFANDLFYDGLVMWMLVSKQLVIKDIAKMILKILLKMGNPFELTEVDTLYRPPTTIPIDYEPYFGGDRINYSACRICLRPCYYEARIYLCPKHGNYLYGCKCAACLNHGTMCKSCVDLTLYKIK